MLIQSLFSLIVLVLVNVHPYFVSIWDIELKEETNMKNDIINRKRKR